MFRTPQLAGHFHLQLKVRAARTKLWALALALQLALLAGRPAWSQATTSLRGTVSDPSGAYIAGATVTLTNPLSKIVRTTVTGDNDGGYQFQFLPPGTYTLEVEAKGFQNYEQKGLELLVNTPVTINVQLKVGGGQETVR
jgi:Carboxypeptidase regulatory-like domain